MSESPTSASDSESARNAPLSLATRDDTPDDSISSAPAGALDLRYYELFDQLGRGGVGEVYRSRDPGLGRDLALKVLRPELQGKAEVEFRFEQEARITGMLQHPGIVPVHNLGRLPDGRLYFTMKIVRGNTLAEILGRHEEKPVERQGEIVAIFEKVCQTIAYAHSKGVIHRDLKPGNVMVGAFGEVQVMDWGLAKVLVSDAYRSSSSEPNEERFCEASLTEGERTHLGAILGTPAYMAPEQARGDIHLVDERSDVFGLGAILCEILTGKPPYSGPTGAVVHGLALRGELAPAWERLDRCGAEKELIDLAKRCLAVELGQRLPDGEAVAAAVSAHLAGVRERLRAAELAAAAAEVRAKSERRARRLTLGLVGSVLLTVLLGGGGLLWLRQVRGERRAEIGSRASETLGRASQLADQARKARGGTPAQREVAQAVWKEALALADQAGKIVEVEEADQQSRQHVLRVTEELRGEQAEDQRDLDMLHRLEKIRLLGTEVNAGGTIPGPVVEAYRQAFLDYRLDVLSLPIEESARQIRNRSIRDELVAALDGWAWKQIRLKPTSPEWKRLFSVARAVENDPWRNAFRGALAQNDRKAFNRLLEAKEVDGLPMATLELLADILNSWSMKRHTGLDFLVKLQHRHPGNFWFNYVLGLHYHWGENPPQWDQALRYYAAAVAVNPRCTSVLAQYAWTLHKKGLRQEAVAVYHDILRVEPNHYNARLNLGGLLLQMGLPGRAIDEGYAPLVRHWPDVPEARCWLGWAYRTNNLPDKAMPELRQAIKLSPGYAKAHYYLGIVLADKGRLDEAVGQYRKALALDPSNVDVHYSLGVAARANNNDFAAIDHFRKYLERKPNDIFIRCQLSAALSAIGEAGAEEALSQAHKALTIDPNHPVAHCRMGLTLLEQGRFDEALRSLKRGHEIGSRQADWKEPSAKWISQCERMQSLARQLPAILKGKPAAPGDLFDLPRCARYQRLYHASARLYARALSAEAKKGNTPNYVIRYNAACVAALVGAGKGKDAAGLGDEERSRWRIQAVDWLRDELVRWTREGTGLKGPARVRAREQLTHWQKDADLTGIRDDSLVDKLPQADRRSCKKLWDEVARLRKKLDSSR